MQDVIVVILVVLALAAILYALITFVGMYMVLVLIAEMLKGKK
ncbi:hypothetical protein ACQ4M3_19325 [Leptolyngbya sp. AN03gr2]